MGHQSVVDLIGWVGPLNTTIKALRVLTKDHCVDLRLLDCAPEPTSDEV